VIVILDAGPLGMVGNPQATDLSRQAKEWLKNLVRNGHRVAIPEIADYEVRRELIRADLHDSIARLDALRGALEFWPITTQVMEQAARFWAEARKRGLPTCHDAALDGDVILAAHAATHAEALENVVIATTNVGDLAQFVPAKLWHDIG
jgi:predicted nucleic acid-binding protein